jgi:hypothetical protein
LWDGGSLAYETHGELLVKLRFSLFTWHLLLHSNLAYPRCKKWFPSRPSPVLLLNLLLLDLLLLLLDHSLLLPHQFILCELLHHRARSRVKVLGLVHRLIVVAFQVALELLVVLGRLGAGRLLVVRVVGVSASHQLIAGGFAGTGGSLDHLNLGVVHLKSSLNYPASTLLSVLGMVRVDFHLRGLQLREDLHIFTLLG